MKKEKSKHMRLELNERELKLKTKASNEHLKFKQVKERWIIIMC